MLKPFQDRVKSNYHLMQAMISWMASNADLLRAEQIAARETTQQATKEVLSWEIDTTNVDSLKFMGYKAGYKPSEVSGIDRLYYDHDSTFTKTIPYYNHYKAIKTMDKPTAFYIPKAWEKVVERLKWNGVEVIELDKAVEVKGAYYRIENYETVSNPFEGHYLHYNIEAERHNSTTTFEIGDFKVPLGQISDKYTMAVLAPEAPDAFLAWNFFDIILQQKEYFSTYVFEDEAAQLLIQNPDWKKELDSLRSVDEVLANSARAQLNWIYRKSDHYEKEHLRYPVFFGESETFVATNVYSD